MRTGSDARARRHEDARARARARARNRTHARTRKNGCESARSKPGNLHQNPALMGGDQGSAGPRRRKPWTRSSGRWGRIQIASWVRTLTVAAQEALDEKQRALEADSNSFLGPHINSRGAGGPGGPGRGAAGAGGGLK